MDRVKKIVHYWCDDTRNKAYTGRKITAAILDTGLSPHPDVQGRVIAFTDCVHGRQGLYDDSGHGTHVAGILAGDGKLSKGILSGMAPEADLVILKVLDKKGNGSLSQIEAGICWILKNWKKYRIRVVNISMGARCGVNPEKETEMIRMVEELWDMGIVVVVSAGNYGPEAGTVSVPGTSRKVITVGAMESGEKTKECSGQGPTKECVVKPDLVAPGYHIISCSHQYQEYRRAYTVKSGSSMATPVVAGTAALVFSKYPDMSNVELKLKLRETSRPVKALTETGWGCLQADALLR